MTVYCDDTEQHAVVPRAVFVARRDGQIDLLEFDILCLWCLLVDYKTRVVSSWSAEVFRHWAGASAPSVRTVRRAVARLRELGWMISGYVPGDETPYDMVFPVPDGDRPQKTNVDRPSAANFDRAKKQINGEESAPSGYGSDFVTVLPEPNVTVLISDKVTANNHGGQEISENQHPADPEIAFQAKGKHLRRSLSRSITQILHTSKVISAYYEERLSWVADAHGIEVVEKDFAIWCGEHVGDDWSSCTPFQAYSAVVDDRLGTVTKPRPDVHDPRVTELVNGTYAEIGLLPPRKSVAELLVEFSADEIKRAVEEFYSGVSNLKDRQISIEMMRFWSEDGARAVILVRRRRNGK